jgi:hypothetical protein
MKRYKVVQDARGYWGIWDREANYFAAWGYNSSTGADLLDEIIYYAWELNSGKGNREEFVWDGEYLPKGKA